MHDLPLLSLLTFLPLIGCGFIATIRGSNEAVRRNVRAVALMTAIATLALAFFVYAVFEPQSNGFQLVEMAPWISFLNAHYHMGIDGLSMPFLLLTTLLIPAALLASWSMKTPHIKEYYCAFLLLECLLIGMFCSLDIVQLYVLFEATLIPMFFIIGIWGGGRRVYAAYKFFLYTLLGSVLMLVAIIILYTQTGTTDLTAILKTPLSTSLQQWLWPAFFIAFAIKIPMWPFHTWLPDAHVEAPTAGSMILAGILLKIGGYGFLRITLPLFPEANLLFAPLVYSLSLIAIVYTSFIALTQNDMKKLIAYSSIAHMGLVTLGIFTFSVIGIQGAIFHMFSHGLSSSALFLCVGVLYDRYHSRLIEDYGGLASKMPLFATVFMIFLLTAIGLPGTMGFIGEILVLIATYQTLAGYVVFAGIGLILGAAYMLWLYQRLFLGALKQSLIKTLFTDLTVAEKMAFAPLVLLVIGLGLYPMPILSISEITVKGLAQPYEKSFHSLDSKPNKNIKKAVRVSDIRGEI